MIKIIPLLILCLLGEGCLGLGTRTTQTETIQDPVIIDGPIADGIWDRRVEPTNTIVYTSAWLDAHWGKPTSISRTSTSGLVEIWTYKFDRIWEGAIPFVVIPIPLVLPVGREQVLFVLRDGRVISGTKRQLQWGGGAVGFCVGPCGVNFGAFSF
jgi:hypothetical protein